MSVRDWMRWPAGRVSTATGKVRRWFASLRWEEPTVRELLVRDRSRTSWPLAAMVAAAWFRWSSLMSAYAPAFALMFWTVALTGLPVSMYAAVRDLVVWRRNRTTVPLPAVSVAWVKTAVTLVMVAVFPFI